MPGDGCLCSLPLGAGTQLGCRQKMVEPKRPEICRMISEIPPFFRIINTLMIHYENMYCNQNIYLIYLPQYHSNILFLGSRVSGIKPVQLAPMIGKRRVYHGTARRQACQPMLQAAADQLTTLEGLDASCFIWM